MKRKPRRRSPIVADLRSPKYKPRKVRNRKRYDRKKEKDMERQRSKLDKA